VAVTYRGDKAMAAAAIADVIALSGVTAIMARAAAGRLAVVCAVTGFTLPAAAGAVTALTPATALIPATALTPATAQSGCAALAAALCGAALALLPRHAVGSGPAGRAIAEAGRAIAPASRATAPARRAIAAAGLCLAAAGFGALYLAETQAQSGRMLTLLYVPLAAGLSAALTSSLRGTGTAGAMAGVVLLLAGVVVGSLAVGSMQLNALAGARTARAVHDALVTAAGRWALVAAVLTAVVALALAGTAVTARRGGRRSARKPGGGLDQIAGGSPPPPSGDTPSHG
jgi:hypothetical protein